MKLAIQLGILSSLNIGIAFLYQWYVFTQLGPGMETDALFAGMAVPQLMLTVVTGSLVNVLVPLLAGEEEKQVKRDAWGFVLLIAGVFGVIVGVLYFTAHWWVPITVSGFSETGKILTISLTRIQLIGIFFASISSVEWAVYHSKQLFLWAEFTPILSSITGFLILIWTLPHFGVTAAAWVMTLRVILQTLLLAPGMGRPVMPKLNSQTIVTAWHRIKPLLLGTAYYKTEPVVDRFLLSWATSGSLSLYYFAQQLYGAINQICNKALTAPLVPRLGKLYKEKKSAEFRKAYYRKLLLMLTLGLLVILMIGILGKPLLTLLVGHGRVTASNVNEIWWIMLWLGGMLVGGMAGQITSSTFYACGDTVTPTKLSMCSYTIYIPLKVGAFYWFGIKGLAISTSIYFLANLIWQMIILAKREILVNEV